MPRPRRPRHRAPPRRRRARIATERPAPELPSADRAIGSASRLVAILPVRPAERASVLPPRIEPPHAHAVCRLCGRIADVDLRLEDLRQLEELAQRRPEGWYVEGITFSLTGACPRCRHGTRPE